MKKIILITATTFILLLSFTGCDKYHRDRYTGTWDFVTIRRFFEGELFDNQNAIQKDTIYYNGKIFQGSSENELIIQYTKSDEIAVHLSKDKDGSFTTMAQGCIMRDCKGGEFKDKDNLYINLYWGVWANYEGPYDYKFEYVVGSRRKEVNNE